MEGFKPQTIEDVPPVTPGTSVEKNTGLSEEDKRELASEITIANTNMEGMEKFNEMQQVVIEFQNIDPEKAAEIVNDMDPEERKEFNLKLKKLGYMVTAITLIVVAAGSIGYAISRGEAPEATHFEVITETGKVYSQQIATIISVVTGTVGGFMLGLKSEIFKAKEKAKKFFGSDKKARE